MGPHCKIGLGVAEHGKRQESMSLRQHIGSGETMHRPGMGSTSSGPEVPQMPLACQSAKFGIDVQSRRRTCWPYRRAVPASARAYATGLGDSLRNVQSLFLDERNATTFAFCAADRLRLLARGWGGYLGRFDFCSRCRLPSVISEPSGAITS